MNLDEYVENVMVKNGIDLERKEGIIRGICAKAKSMAEGDCACVDNETIDEWIINPKTFEMQNLEPKKKEKPIKPAGHSEERYGQISLF